MVDFNNSQTHAQNRPQPEPFVPSGGKKKSRAKFPRINNLTSAALVLIAIILLVFGLLWYFRGGFSEGSYINKSEYQAVFLSNGQVYFGKLDKLTSQYAELTDIYYLQVNQTVQPDQSGSSSSSSQPQNVQLVKLGNELHGPEDAMQINRDQVVFWENLKPSGKVSQAIAQYQKNGDKGTPSTTTSTTPSTTNTPSSTNNSTSNSNESTNTSTTPSSSTTGNTSTTPETTKP